MPKAIFLFDGGFYKRGVDSGKVRVPLTPQEAEIVQYDPEMQVHTDNSIGAEINFAKYASELCNLAVGDEIFVGLVPPASVARGLWVMSHDSVPGFTVEVDLVSVKDVYNEYTNNGYATSVATSLTGGDKALAYDFANGLGDSTKDAADRAALYGKLPSDYRNLDALDISMFANQIPLGLADTQYIRLTVTDASGLGSSGQSCCTTCGGDAYPTFQVGVIYDRLCADVQRVRKYCSCPEQNCGGGCDSDCDTGFTVSLSVSGYDEANESAELVATFNGPAETASNGALVEYDPNTMSIQKIKSGDGTHQQLITLIFPTGTQVGDTFDVVIPANRWINSNTSVNNCASNVVTITSPFTLEG